ncbi:MBL fold metallo-hydrolase [Luteolibacter arcticus]|uniref:MBL fold metallo-hydrolase n=1 Tax=Luteolibacter arcticus TaxID=1581411 RepID=A0ABT3GMF9_9BACT|nr:MBL fold metallo-hydrolase [Luteolibacter arcticus]MCW1924666.1 MBL fold metallo-hydrolase [Luteolibacter arcticus]
MRFIVLGSGSGGNATVVEAGGMRLLVDAGLSAKQLTDRMKASGIEPASISAVLLTHEHGDHVRGLRVLMKQLSAPIYATPSTTRLIRDGGIEAGSWKIFESGAQFHFNGLSVQSFAVPHDAVEPVGFVFRHEEKSFGLLSDTGHVTKLISERLRGVNALFVEANYDDALLEADTKRPWSTKQRISSRHGHLSNAQTAALVADLAANGLRRVVLGHLSRDCNCPVAAATAVRGSLASVEIVCAEQDRTCGWWD